MGNLKRIGIVTGLKAEQAILLRRRRNWGERMPLLAGAGMGPGAAVAAAERLVLEGANGLMSFGLAGALDPRLAPGALILPAEVRARDGRRYTCDPKWRNDLLRVIAGRFPAVAGSLLAVAEPAVTPQEKANLRTGSEAIAVDMESAGAAEVAERHRLPFLAVRAIADTATQRLPPAARLAIDAAGGFRLGAVLGSLLRDPRQLADLLALARASAVAMRALAGVCDLAGPRLGLSG